MFIVRSFLHILLLHQCYINVIIINIFVIDNPRRNVIKRIKYNYYYLISYMFKINAFKRLLSEFTFVDNKDKKSITFNRFERFLKRFETQLMTLNFSFRINLLILNSLSIYFLISFSSSLLSATQNAFEKR